MGQPPVRPGAPYVVEPIHSEIAPDASIGSKAAGLLCLPNGSLTWRDVDLPAERDMTAALTTAIQSDVSKIAQSPRQASYRLSATITAAHIDKCVPHYGGGARILGLSKTIKGRGSISVRWRVFEPNATIAKTEIVVDQSIKFDKSERRLGSIVASAVVESAAVFLARSEQARR